MKFQFAKKILFLLFIIPSIHGYASHIYGGHLSYEKTGQPNQFKVVLDVISACGHVATTTNTVALEFSNDCNTTVTNSFLYLNQSVVQPNLCTSEMSQFCTSSLGGVEIYTYSGYITLPSNCSNYQLKSTIIHGLSSDNTIGPRNLYLEVELNNSNGIQNTSPIIHAPKAVYVNINTPISLELGAIDADNDSLVYSLVGTRTASNSYVQYATGYSALIPIQGMSIDAQTGIFSFLPTMYGVYTVVILIEEYNSNGVFTGSSLIDFPVFVNNYNAQPNYAMNHFPFFDSTISNFNNFGTNATFLTGPNRIKMCEGDQFCFDITLNDTADVNDSLFFITNLTDMLPNATMSITGTNPKTATLCWTFTAGFENYDVMFMGRDDDCPIYGFEFFRFRVEADKPIGFTYDDKICGDMTVNLNSNQNTPYQWSVLTGDPIVIGNNFSCNNCSSPVASPQVTTTYLVETLNDCNDSDTITINVFDTNLGDLETTILTADTTVCIGECIELNVNAVQYNQIYNNQTFANTSNSFVATNSTVLSTMFIPAMALSSATISPNNISKICIDIDHAFTGALNIYLISPAGTSFELSTGNGAGANYSGTCFETNGVTNVINGTAPFSNTYIPEGGPLTNLFVGENVQGIWQLQVENTSSINSAAIISWSIDFSEPSIISGSPDSLSWSNLSGMLLPQQANAVICPNVPGQYVLTTYNEFNCFERDTINIGVNPTSYTGVDTSFNVYLYQGVIDLYNYTSSGAVNNGVWLDSITGDSINHLVKADSLSNPTTFIYVTENSFGCYDSSYVIFDMFGYCDVPPGAPSPYITALPDAGLDSTVYVGLYSGVFDLFDVLNTGVSTTGYWRDTTGVTLNTTLFDPNTFPSGISYIYVATNENGCEDSAKYTIFVLDDLSIGESNVATNFSLYPNPAKNDFTISFTNSGQYEVKLLNQLGQVMVPTVFMENEGKINVSTLSNGIYYLSIKGQGIRVLEKIIIQD
ncbi:hypothetical protein DNU06_08215 [Putridiphycobacter roseus]|uniref:P/Homo B domain-containing protein n=1 Tax=Putridiphycobacter roseus TaxID=2219161 RepID=A0A2W1NRG0_9FLAO|nr:T9SS type A sorting domain-containing protein [Putridiphycobacter roseus]PZE17248.1 hypothetical protein DNU06_08215 [Putridiphycobacter roseus]